MNYTGEAHEAGLACPSTDGGSSGSGGAPGEPTPANILAVNAEQEDEEEVFLEGDLPPDHYITHRPKMAACEACQ